MERQVSRLFPALRDLALLLGGLALLWHETAVVLEPRLPLLAVAIGMLGLPASLLVDRKLGRSASSPSALAPREPESQQAEQAPP
jgi:hypothetical protein